MPAGGHPGDDLIEPEIARQGLMKVETVEANDGCGPASAVGFKAFLGETRVADKQAWGADTKVRKLSGSRSCAMLAGSAIRAETRFFNVPRGGEGHCL